MKRTRPRLDQIRRLYEETSTIAVVGASPDRSKRAHVIPAYLQSQGYRIIPVNPRHAMVLGETCYPNLLDIADSVDVVDVFRPASEAPDISRHAVAIGARALWLQVGIRSDEAHAIAEAAGLLFVEDHCMGQMHAMVGLGPGPEH
jgi:predicted CoA-binding protein